MASQEQGREGLWSSKGTLPSNQPHLLHWVMGMGASGSLGVTQRDLNVKEAWAQGYTGRALWSLSWTDASRRTTQGTMRSRGGESRDGPALLECPG